MVKNLFYPFLPALAALFLHYSPMVTLTSLPALSLQHNEVELYSGRKRRGGILGTLKQDHCYLEFN